MGQIQKVIDALAADRISTGEAADRLRRIRKFPEPERVPTVQESLGAADDPSGAWQEDDGHELTLARSRGQITPEQYAALYHGYADARKAATGKATAGAA